jgi:hypothetical protein
MLGICSTKSLEMSGSYKEKTMKAKDLLTKLEEQDKLEFLLESYKDSDWRFYLTLKSFYEEGIEKTFYSSMDSQQIQKIEPQKLVNMIVHTCFNYEVVKSSLSNLNLLTLTNKPFLFTKDRVKIVGVDYQIESQILDAKGEYSANLSPDYEPQLKVHKVKIYLTQSGSIRTKFEQKFSDRVYKQDLYLKYLRQQTLTALIREQKNFNLPKFKKHKEIAQEISQKFGWSIEKLESALNEPGLGTNWDFDLRDLSLIRQLFQALNTNSSILILLSAKKVNNIVEKQWVAEQKDSLSLLGIDS